MYYMNDGRFNEAAAAMPRMSSVALKSQRWCPRFNEAGATLPRMRSCTIKRPITNNTLQ